MPDWASINVHFEGTPEAIATITTAVKPISGCEADIMLDLDVFAPTPAPLAAIESRRQIVTAEQKRSNNGRDIAGRPLFSYEQAEGFLAQYGAADWYDWCVKNWGTKWSPTGHVTAQDATSLTLSLLSAYNAPYLAFETIRTMPGVSVVEWVDACGEEVSHTAQALDYFTVSRRGEHADGVDWVWHDVDLRLRALHPTTGATRVSG